MNTVTLSTGKVLTEEELDEVREIIRFEDDKEDVEDCLSSGYFEGEEWYMDVPEDAISEIAGRKAELERQKDMSWTAAADRAIEEWMRAHSSHKEAVKMQLTKAAKEHSIDLEIYRFIDAEHQDSLWYGGVIATAKKGSLRCEISAQGDVYASLLRSGREIADVRDKCNSGEFYCEMKKFIPNDDALLILQRGAQYGDLELHLENGNWFEWHVFDEAQGEWIGPDSLDNIAEVDGVAECLDPKYLETIFDYALEYEKGGYHQVF